MPTAAWSAVEKAEWLDVLTAEVKAGTLVGMLAE